MLVDSTYFVGKRFIPNLNEPDVNNRSNSDLQTIIDDVEEQVLSSIFGREMWIDFKSKYQNKDTVPLEQNYENMVKGCVYEFDGKKYYWRGILEIDKNQSFLADLIYYEHKSQFSSLTTESGETKLNLKAGENVSNIPKMVEAFNSFAEKCFGSFRGLPDGLTLEGNPFWLLRNGGVDFYGINRDNENVSFIQFLHDNQSDYPLIKFNFGNIDFEYKNSFGI